MRITPEGKVTPCPYMPVVAGDLLTQSFREIWETSPVFDDLRTGELGGRCGKCEYREICGGCRARAYGVTGDLMAEDPLCTHQPDTFPEARLLPIATVEYGTGCPDRLVGRAFRVENKLAQPRVKAHHIAFADLHVCIILRPL